MPRPLFSGLSRSKGPALSALRCSGRSAECCLLTVVLGLALSWACSVTQAKSHHVAGSIFLHADETKMESTSQDPSSTKDRGGL